jgi:hypothetical protein
MESHIRELLKGTIDLHVHCDPSFMFRHGDALDLANDAINAGMRAICVKDHHFGTASAAFIANKHHIRSEGPFECFASLCLNHSAGGFSLYVLEMNLRFGVKQVYFPTISDRTPMRPIKNVPKGDNPGAFLPVRVKPPGETPLFVLDENGMVRREVMECIELIRDYGVILSTGHLDYEEAYKVVKAAVEMGCKKILLTHFDAPEILFDKGDRKRSLNEMKEIQALGDCIVEYTYAMTVNGASTMEYQLEAIDFFGVDRVCLGTDSGSRNYPPLIECWEGMLKSLIAHGYSDGQIAAMCGLNQRELLGLKD